MSVVVNVALDGELAPFHAQDDAALALVGAMSPHLDEAERKAAVDELRLLDTEVRDIRELTGRITRRDVDYSLIGDYADGVPIVTLTATIGAQAVPTEGRNPGEPDLSGGGERI